MGIHTGMHAYNAMHPCIRIHTRILTYVRKHPSIQASIQAGIQRYTYIYTRIQARTHAPRITLWYAVRQTYADAQSGTHAAIIHPHTYYAHIPAGRQPVMRMHTYMHTRLRTHMQSYMGTGNNQCGHACRYVCIICVWMYDCGMRASAQAHNTHPQVIARICNQAGRNAHTCIHPYIQAVVHTTITHIHIHASIRTHA